MPGDTFYWPVNRSDRGSSAVGEEVESSDCRGEVNIRMLVVIITATCIMSICSCKNRYVFPAFLSIQNDSKGTAQLALWFEYSFGQKSLRVNLDPCCTQPSASAFVEPSWKLL